MARFEFDEPVYRAMTQEYGRQARHHFADPIVRDAKIRAPELTGELKVDIHQFDEGSWTYIGSGLKYTAAQEMGAEPHDIEGVLHPGNEAQRFLRSALYTRRAA